VDWLANTVAAVRQVAPGAAAPDVPPAVGDLPLVEVPAASNPTQRAAGEIDPEELFAVLVSGDGGWAGIDRDLADLLAARGIPVVGVDSLRYFWTARQPDGFAKDLDRIIRAYAKRFDRPRVLLIGYSQGADVLPFALRRLPTATRARIERTALLGLSRKAAFEFHLSNWIGPSGDLPIAPELAALAGLGITGAQKPLCIYGVDDRDATCDEAPAGSVIPIARSGGHHYDGDYPALVRLILTASPAPVERAEVTGKGAKVVR